MTKNFSAPNSKESEMMVLGCMLTSINSLNSGADHLDEGDFYFPEHRIIFHILKEAYRQDRPADVHLVCEELKRQGKLEEVGGAAYVATLAQYAGTSAYLEEYAEIVKAKSILRKMIDAARVVEKSAREEPQDVHGTLDDAQALFFKISQTANPGSGLTIKDVLAGYHSETKTPFLKAVQERQERYRLLGPDQPKITGIPTHFLDLDNLVNGLGDSNLMIIAGRPAMGKTAFALNVAENVCFKNNMPVGIFSLEMTAEQLIDRIVCSQAEVEAEKIRTGALSGVEFQRIVAAVGEMQKHTLIIDDQPGLKITDLRARARRMKESYGIRLLIIDYLQLIGGSGSSRTLESRQNEVSEISRMLKTLARELNIPILCPSQLSRKVEDRAGHRPMMSDLRESGCLLGSTCIVDAITHQAYTMQQLAENPHLLPIYVHAVDTSMNVGIYPMHRVFYSGKKTVYRLRTHLGHEIVASANHPFLALRSEEASAPVVQSEGQTATLTQQWIALEKLQAGDLLAFILEGQLHWDAIISIKEGPEADVFDATVDVVHNFEANGLIVHNSIEQDSDVIAFLLRRDYYDPNDKPGMAELIVAKNRHGSIGNINLTFVKELGQFRNYTPIQVELDQESPFASL
ncbi:MAG: replicative DNA helicase [Verrucomicrobia bacterium]|nr:replicative DNA helicase [Verrucomicrobiota bacterium]MBS0645388.1 replicative DNA helicase [Verrucomicrobiota bacterium]